jgi:hypothetical protein
VKPEEVKDGQRVVLRDKDGDCHGSIIGGVFVGPYGNQEPVWREATWVKWDNAENPKTCLVSILEISNKGSKQND